MEMDLSGSLAAPAPERSENLESIAGSKTVAPILESNGTPESNGTSEAHTPAPASPTEPKETPEPKQAPLHCDIIPDEKKTSFVWLPGTFGCRLPCQRRLIFRPVPQFMRLGNVHPYEIKSSLAQDSIKRSHKDFEVLRNLLLKTYSPLTLPPISHGASDKLREVELRQFSHWIVRHPFLRRCKVWKSFLNDDEWASHKTFKVVAEIL